MTKRQRIKLLKKIIANKNELLDKLYLRHDNLENRIEMVLDKMKPFEDELKWLIEKPKK